MHLNLRRSDSILQISIMFYSSFEKGSSDTFFEKQGLKYTSEQN